MQGYFAAGKSAQSEFTEKKSRFITLASPVATVDEAESFIAGVKAEYPDARHHCFAYRIHQPSVERYSDDGEPQGTAGPPMLGVLQKEGIEDICVVVVRYFGGILLGTGGLTRAYSKGCSDGVAAAGKYYKCPAAVLKIEAPYDRFSAVERLLEKTRHILKEKSFAQNVALTVLIPEKEADGFCETLTELSGGKITVKQTGEQLAAFDKF